VSVQIRGWRPMREIPFGGSQFVERCQYSAKQTAGKSEWWVQSGGRLGSCPQQLIPKWISQTNL
jgi:hypothetical protein